MADIKDGETAEMQGSAKKPYILKNVGGAYSCSCPAWRNQSASIDLRTCKHLIKFRGSEAEHTRLGEAFPEKGSKKVKARSAATTKKQAEAAKNKPPALLAHSWDPETDPTGWWMSEKLDGVRAWWDGETFYSRTGNVYHAPEWFKEGLPKMPLDGELWLARGEFQKCVSIVRKQSDDADEWCDIKYLVFDAPALELPFEERMEMLSSLEENLPPHVKVLPQSKCISKRSMLHALNLTEKDGGEGLMLRKPGSMYEAGRSNTLLKVKTFHDAEATVVGHSPGKGRHKGRLGALECSFTQDPNGPDEKTINFSVGSGFSDEQRDNPPAIGSTITYRYQELTKAGKPRFPTYVRIREDL